MNSRGRQEEEGGVKTVETSLVSSFSKSHIFHNCFYLGKKGVSDHPEPKRKKNKTGGTEKYFPLENKPTESRERSKSPGEKRLALKGTNVLADSHPRSERRHRH